MKRARTIDRGYILLHAWFRYHDSALMRSCPLDIGGDLVPKKTAFVQVPWNFLCQTNKPSKLF